MPVGLAQDLPYPMILGWDWCEIYEVLGVAKNIVMGETDASEWALGAVLSPEIEGAFEPVAYTSQKLNPQERRCHESEDRTDPVEAAVEEF
ncbi:hypothetical protein Y1Q_0005259 [Alligator mississippiensis]|uniref:Reverse transcriptase/retrotransposon-derived protein RNase H-like domain-containing protein n=1 Tax=Alligator mississippiensis TaxID=8496 RepID=A0A151MT70_ALLMI|nr:hypothetical protein Y1Q_0005259 [Alligator mississippiensis]